MTDFHEFGGTDHGWLACDAMDHLAILIIFGLGPIPTSVLDGPVKMPDIEERLEGLPVNGSARPLHKDESAYAEFAERGIFVYDWDRGTEPHGYKIMAAPPKPLLLSELPEDLRRVAESTRYSEIEFAQSSELGLPAGSVALWPYHP